MLFLHGSRCHSDAVEVLSRTGFGAVTRLELLYVVEERASPASGVGHHDLKSWTLDVVRIFLCIMCVNIALVFFNCICLQFPALLFEEFIMDFRQSGVAFRYSAL